MGGYQQKWFFLYHKGGNLPPSASSVEDRPCQHEYGFLQPVCIHVNHQHIPTQIRKSESKTKGQSNTKLQIQNHARLKPNKNAYHSHIMCQRCFSRFFCFENNIGMNTATKFTSTSEVNIDSANHQILCRESQNKAHKRNKTFAAFIVETIQ